MNKKGSGCLITIAFVVALAHVLLIFSDVQALTVRRAVVGSLIVP